MAIFKIVVKSEQLDMKTSVFIVMRVLINPALVGKYCLGFEDGNNSDDDARDGGTEQLGVEFGLVCVVLFIVLLYISY